MISSVIIVLIITSCNLTLGNPGTFYVSYYRLKVNFANKGSTDYKFAPGDRLFNIFPNTSSQKAYLIETIPDVKKIIKDEDGNLLAELDFPETIGPGENFTAIIVMKLNLTYRSIPKISVESSGSLSDIPAELVNYTLPSGAWKYNSISLRYIADLASQIKGNDTNVLGIVSKMVKFIGSKIEYPYEEYEAYLHGKEEGMRRPQYPNETLPNPEEKGRGDCDDQAVLLITMLRSVGVPAYLQIGGIIKYHHNFTARAWDGHLILTSSGIAWHAWAEVYVPPWGWLPVDTTFGFNFQRDPLTSITFSAPAIKILIQLKKYSNIDYIGENSKVERELRNSDLYAYVEEEVSVTPFPSSHQIRQSEREDTTSTALLMLLVVLLIIAVIFILYKRKSTGMINLGSLLVILRFK